MTARAGTGLASLVLALLALTGCAGPSTTGDAAGGPPTSSAPSSPAPTSTAAPGLGIADSALGSIVVDGAGMTVYMFDKDTQGSGESSCAGDCLTAWPPVTTTGDAPTADGVTGELAAIPTADGARQVTVNGWPLYTYTGDAAPGDVTGQGVGGVWWVLTPAGERLADGGADGS